VPGVFVSNDGVHWLSDHQRNESNGLNINVSAFRDLLGIFSGSIQTIVDRGIDTEEDQSQNLDEESNFAQLFKKIGL
jgi:hypothetical protein